ncbi:porin family protein [Aquimarina algicola]|uniref:PorT family protein n=1 Tax=Aquimarina algicola TaxID=2589995 RepID=A0A504J311_9FLAO|nr:porin family protein [Aquimarina algicola]TPN85326.1 PorT family protein [Aquimarina algicola]
MKNVFVLLVLFSSSILLAQQEKKLALGVKAGLNYGDNGEIEIADVSRISADDRVGYHVGLFLRGKLTDNLYLKPELQYTVNNSTYEVNGQDLDYNVKKLDLPILLGVNLIGPVHVFGGPALQYIVENDLDDVRLRDVKNDFTVGLQFGAGLQLGRINADIRYERGLSKNRAESIDEDIRVDSRPNQFILSLGVDF